MKNIKNIFTLLVVALVGLSLTACSEDDLGTNQYQGAVSLNAFGPNPVMRGGTLRFVGSNLDQIASIQIPGVTAITNYEIVKAGVPSEIRVVVPKDGPEVGYVTLKTKTDQTITTKSELTYTEPIEFEGFSPASAMPGDVVTITGDYLNLVYSLAFADGALVSSNDFLSQDRYSITVTVPENAQTGKIELYTADLTLMTDEDEDDLEYQIIGSENAIEIGTPSIVSLSGRNTAEFLGDITAKVGETITITGTYFNMVDVMKIGGVEVCEINVTDENKILSFTLPAEVPSGEILIVCKSGIEVPVGTLTTVKPSNCVATPSPVKAGEKLTITGQDLDIVTGVTFQNVDSLFEEIEVSAEKVVIKEVPKEAQNVLSLVMASGETVEIVFELVKPTITAYNANPISAGSELQVTGTDLDLVKTVTFGNATATVEEKISADGTTLTVTIPMEATSGAPKFNLANGTSVDGAELTINEAVFCYAIELPSEDAENIAGSTMSIIVANSDKLTSVQMNGVDCQWILTGEDKNQLIIGIPETAKANSTLRLISSNGEITYNVAVIPATSVTKIVWKGLVQLSWGDGGQIFIPASAFEDVPAGAVLTFYYSQVDQQWDQAQVNYGDWSGINFTEEGEGITTFEQTLVPTDVYGWFEDGILDRETSIILTQEILSNIAAKKDDSGNGVIIQGTGLTFSKVTVSYENILEIDLATIAVTNSGTAIIYPFTFTWNADGQINLTKEMLDEIGVKKGSKFLVYKELSATGQVQINNSSWIAIYTIADWSQEKEVLEQEFDDAMMEAYDGGYWIQGDLGRVTKIAILP